MRRLLTVVTYDRAEHDVMLEADDSALLVTSSGVGLAARQDR